MQSTKTLKVIEEMRQFHIKLPESTFIAAYWQRSASPPTVAAAIRYLKKSGEIESANGYDSPNYRKTSNPISSNKSTFVMITA